MSLRWSIFPYSQETNNYFEFKICAIFEFGTLKIQRKKTVVAIVEMRKSLLNMNTKDNQHTPMKKRWKINKKNKETNPRKQKQQ